MKLWTISVLLLVLICLTIPFVTADEKKGDIGKGKIKTPAMVEKKNLDLLEPVKKLIGMESDKGVEIIINGKKAAVLPQDSPIIDVSITNECIAQHPYGSQGWYDCEVK